MIGGTLSNPGDFAMASDGNIYVVDDFSIKVFSSGFGMRNYLPVKEIVLDGDPLGQTIATDDDGHFYLARGDHKVYKYTLSGEYVMSFGGKGQAPGLFDTIGDLALDAAGNIYVADTYNNRIQKFDLKGKLLQVFTGEGESRLVNPTQIKVDAQNKLYVIDKQRFQRFTPDGLVDYRNTDRDPTDVAIDAQGFFYITHGYEYFINKHASDGYLLETFLGHGHGDGQINTHKTRLVVDHRNDIHLLEINHTYTDRNRIQKFNTKLAWMVSSTDYMFTYLGPFLNRDYSSIAFDASGNYYIGNRTWQDPSFKWVELFDKYGSNVRAFDMPGNPDTTAYVRDIAVDPRGEVYVLAAFDQGYLHKYTATGNFIATLIPRPIISEPGFSPEMAFLDKLNNIYLADGFKCLKFNATGKLVSRINFESISSQSNSPIKDILVDAAGHFLVVHDVFIKRFDPAGKFISQFSPLGPNPFFWEKPAAIAIDNSGYIYVADRLTIRKFDISGKLVSTIPGTRRHIDTNIKATLSVSPDGASIRVGLNDDAKYFNVIKTYISTDLRPVYQVTGTIFSDVNSNCIQEEGEMGLEGITVSATPGPYYTRTNKSGNYTFDLGPGEYVISQVLPKQTGKQIQQICALEEQDRTVELNDNGNTAAKVNFANRLILSPYLLVSVSSTRRRRCFESTTLVHYMNSGFATAPDAKVYLQLPKEVELLSADKSFTRLSDGTYEFTVGDLAAGQSGTITIADLVTCGDESVRGLTVCTRAWITPSNNTPVIPTPTISITGRCNAETGMIRFVVRNSGTADMETSGLYRKYANGELASIEQFRLAAGDSMVLWVPSMGYTWRIEADQPDGNGDNTKVSVTIEGCSDAEAASAPGTGNVNLLPTDDEEAEVSEECMMITDSYDPNDKLVTPEGRTAEHYTPTNTALKYKIRFQNTGTDVAYRIVVVDTLSEHLDLSTLQVGAASHAHRFEVSGKGQPVLTWTFDNIMLPDSTADEPGSHGYIQFSIKPKADRPEKTLVENFADIFFDFNSPIRTNVTMNRIYDMPPVINEKVRVNMEDVLATPGIEGVAPVAGRSGSEITITGKRFFTIATDNKVYLNSQPATVVSATESELRVLVPAGATSGKFKVVTPDGAASSSETFQVYQPPVLTGFSPLEGTVGQTVTLQGEHLQTDLITGIKLGDLACELVGHESGSVTVRVPPNATTGRFEISTRGGEAMSSAAYTVWYQPAIHSLSQATGIVGATIQISGEQFATDLTRNKVMFGVVQAQVLEATQGQLLVKVPEQAVTDFVSITTPGGKATSSAVFEVIPAPQFVAMQPAKGSVGTVVEISGTNFGMMGLQDRIEFNGQQALVLETTENRYRVRVPRGATTGRIQISGYGGMAYSATDFVVEELSPADAIIVYPNPTTGRFSISLRHADFDLQSVEVFDLLGNLVQKVWIESPRPEALEMSIHAKAGLYLLQFKTAKGLIVKKLTVL